MSEDKYILIDAELFAEFRREVLCVSQGKLANDMGLTVGAVRNWEQGITRGMYLDNFRELAKVAGLDVATLKAKIGIQKPVRLAARRAKSDPPYPGKKQ